MDARCVQYHLDFLVYAFNERKITNKEFKEIFFKIRSFKGGNHKTIEILLLGIKENKR